jgi:DNA-binding LacI/PurR family transcriptional regulator
MAAEALRSVVKNIEAGIEIESRVFQPEFIVRGSTASIPLEGIV